MTDGRSTTKRCSKCDLWLDRALFDRHKKMRAGRSAKCKACRKSARQALLQALNEKRKLREILRLQGDIGQASDDADETNSLKYCPGCQRWLSRTLYGKNVSLDDGLANRCRACKTATRKKLRSSWSDERKQANADRRQAWLDCNAERPAETTPKVCPECKQLVDRALFRRNKARKDGSALFCTPCANAKSSRRYYALSDEQKAVEAARAKVLREQNKDAITETARAYRAINSKKINATKRLWKAANKDTVRLNGRIGQAKRRCVVGSFTLTDIADIRTMQNDKCAYCRKSLKRAYHADHIMPLALGGTNDRQNIQLTCARCNLSKNAKHPLVFARSRGLLL